MNMDSREFRRSYIGGGDAAAIAGVSPWGSPYSLWQMKRGEEPEREPSERMKWGLILEAPIAQEWAQREGAVALRKATFRRHPSVNYVGGHPDYYARHPQDGPVVLEVKTSSAASDWNGPDGDQVPVHYYLQVQHYLMVTGYDVAYLAVLLHGSELRSYRIPADPAVQAGLLQAYEDFWALVQSGTPPEIDGHEATAEAIRRQYPRSDDEEVVGDAQDGHLVDVILGARAQRAQAEEIETGAINRLKARMGTASRLLVPEGTVTWRTSKDRTVINWEAVAKAYRGALEEAYRAGPTWDVGLGSPEFLDALESLHTATLPGARPFRVTAQEVSG